MKKFIPILSISIASVCLQNCTNRDEENISDYHQFNETGKSVMMRGDSTQLSGQILDPDPPVRDGDNWRLIPHN